MVLSIDHIELIVRDVDQHVEFYQKMGFNLLLRTSHHGGSAELQLPGPNQPVIEIHSVSGEETIGVNHIAFKVNSAQEAYEDVVSQGHHSRAGTALRRSHRQDQRERTRPRWLEGAAGRRRQKAGPIASTSASFAADGRGQDVAVKSYFQDLYL